MSPDGMRGSIECLLKRKAGHKEGKGMGSKNEDENHRNRKLPAGYGGDKRCVICHYGHIR